MTSAASSTPSLPSGAPYSIHNLASPTRPSLLQFRQSPRLDSPLPQSPLSAGQQHKSASSDRVTRFTNCRIIRNHTLVKEDVWIKHGQFIDPAKRFWEAQALNEFAADLIVDCGGRILAPGFIDIQINGAFGFDFSLPTQRVRASQTPLSPMPPSPSPSDQNGSAQSHDGNSVSNNKSNNLSVQTDRSADSTNDEESVLASVIAEGLRRVSLGLLKHGVTAYCPTIITSAPNEYRRLLPHYAPRAGSTKCGAAVIGVHCEGPFITRKGAHTESLMVSTNITETAMIDMYGKDSLSNIKIITCAPEIPNMSQCLAYMKRHHPHVVLAAGHSSASFDQAELCVRSGVSLLTHLFNAMIPFTHRDPGITGLIGHNDRQLLGKLHYSMICDDIHTHRASVRIAYQSHSEGAILITDAMAAMGLEHSFTNVSLGHTQVTIESDENDAAGVRRKAVVRGTQTLAGSIATLNECVQSFRRATAASIVEACEAASLHPAECLGIDSKGRLDYGCDADIVLLDDELNVLGVWIAGDQAWVTDGAVTQKSPE